MKKGVFQEPPDGSNRLAWFIIACLVVPAGCAAVIDGLFFSDYSMIGRPSYDLPQALFGLGMVLRLVAELVGKDRMTLAGSLQLTAILLLIAACIGFWLR